MTVHAVGPWKHETLVSSAEQEAAWDWGMNEVTGGTAATPEPQTRIFQASLHIV